MSEWVDIGVELAVSAWQVAYSVLVLLLRDEGWGWITTFALVCNALTFVAAIASAIIETRNVKNKNGYSNNDRCCSLITGTIMWVLVFLIKTCSWGCMVYALLAITISYNTLSHSLKVCIHLFVWGELTLGISLLLFVWFRTKTELLSKVLKDFA